MCEVSRHLYPFRICQLTDHEFDMSMPTFYNYSVTTLLIKLLRCIVRHGTPVHAV
jgi:hypothetical protein